MITSVISTEASDNTVLGQQITGFLYMQTSPALRWERLANTTAVG